MISSFEKNSRECSIQRILERFLHVSDGDTNFTFLLSIPLFFRTFTVVNQNKNNNDNDNEKRKTYDRERTRVPHGTYGASNGGV